jgi:hypothetical protein
MSIAPSPTVSATPRVAAQAFDASAKSWKCLR